LFPHDILYDFALFMRHAWSDRPYGADFLAAPPAKRHELLGVSDTAQGTLHAIKISLGYTDAKGAGFGWLQDERRDAMTIRHDPARLPRYCPVWCALRDFIKDELPALLRAHDGSMPKRDARGRRSRVPRRARLVRRS
jgi:hypothetical protein